jgi:hypothetical protein
VISFRQSAGRGAPEVIADYYTANSKLFFTADGWEEYMDGRKDGRGVQRIWGGTYEVVSEQGDQCELRLHADTEPALQEWSIVFKGADKFELVAPDPKDRTVFARSSTPSRDELVAEAAKSKPNEPELPEVDFDDIYNGMNDPNWGAPKKP